MKTISKLAILLISATFWYACDSSSTENIDPMVPVDPVAVSGPITVLKTGSLTAQSSTNTKGMIQIVTDKDGKYFVRLTEDFTTKFSTGTVTVYLSTSERLQLSSAGSFQLVSIVGKAGEHFFPLAGNLDPKFGLGIIWCGAAAIPFGFAPLN